MNFSEHVKLLKLKHMKKFAKMKDVQEACGKINPLSKHEQKQTSGGRINFIAYGIFLPGLELIVKLLS
jgi:hypothetical protein